MTCYTPFRELENACSAKRGRWGDLHNSEELLRGDIRGKTSDRCGEPLAYVREMRELGPRRSWCVVRLSVHIKSKNEHDPSIFHSDP